MSDLFGHAQPQAQFKDIRNQRSSTAEEKAELSLRLGRLINKCPASVVNGSVQITRQWLHEREQARKLVKSPRASVNELRSAITRMEAYA